MKRYLMGNTILIAVSIIVFFAGFGVASVVYYNPSNSPLLGHGMTGLITNPEDMNQIMKDPEQMQRMVMSTMQDSDQMQMMEDMMEDMMDDMIERMQTDPELEQAMMLHMDRMKSSRDAMMGTDSMMNSMTNQQQMMNGVMDNDMKKIKLVETIESDFDPMVGHEPHQITLLLPPKEGTLYSGTLTFSTSTPVKVIVLQEYSAVENALENTFQGIIDGKKYAMSILLLGSGGTETRTGSIPFAGSGLELHSLNNTAFTANVSIDGWESKLN